MSPKKHRFHDGKRGAAISVRVTPRARHNEIVEVLSDNTIKIRLTAPPAEGKANEALVKFLAEVLDVQASRIEVVAGETGRDKLISILDMTVEQVQKKILEHLA